MGEFPVLRFETVFHIGHINIALKGSNNSQFLEGPCLSVSREPAIWDTILNQPNAPWWRLSKQEAAFLDYCALNEYQKERIIEWGLREGYIKQREGWHICFTDNKYHEALVYEDLKSALEQAREYAFMAYLRSEDWQPYVKKKIIYIATTKLKKFSKSALNSRHTNFNIAIAYTAKVLKFDGVWWCENTNILTGQGDRGGIYNSSLKGWKREKLSSTEIDLMRLKFQIYLLRTINN
jgi:hypothetical protein